MARTDRGSQNRASWLEERRKSIGGSDAAAIVGLSEYSSPYTVWADKTGRLPEKPDNEAMREGRDLEQYVADRWMEATGKRCRRRTEMLRNPMFPWAHANVDRWVVGERAGLECKTVKPYDAETYKEGRYPDRFYVQCMHYMAVTGADRWYLAVLVFGTGFYTYTINRDDDEINALMETERQFWRYVTDDTPPPTDGTKATSDALQTIYQDGGAEGSVDLFSLNGAFDCYFQAKASIKELEQSVRAAENEIKASLGEAWAGTCNRASVTWKPQTRRTFDAERFSADHPELDLSQYYKESTTRIFRVKEIK